jgi:hypothetical protein
MFISQCETIKTYRYICNIFNCLNEERYICNIFNCLNEKNKRFTNYLSLFFFLSSIALCLYFNVRQLKCMGFICNIFNCLNQENKRFTNFLFIFPFIFSCFLFISQHN